MLDFSQFKNKKIKCAGLGEVLFDVYAGKAKLGGAPANFAYHCKQLGLDALMISAVGHDKLGQLARDLIASKFLPALFTTVDKPTGFVDVKLDDHGVPSYLFASDTAYDNMPCTEIMLDVAKNLDLCCFGTLAQRSELTRKTVYQILDNMPKNKSLRVFDINLRRNFYSKQIIEESMKRCEIFKCNEDELPVLNQMFSLDSGASAESFYEILKQMGICCFIFTEGADKSTIFLNEEKSVLPTPKINALDTVGAGDSFTACSVSLLMQGYPLELAHEKAVKLAALVCMRQGAMPDLGDELKDILL